jgi:hypothetical protein
MTSGPTLTTLGLVATRVDHLRMADGTRGPFDTYRVRLVAEFSDGSEVVSKDEDMSWHISIATEWTGASGEVVALEGAAETVRTEIRDAFARRDPLTRWEPLFMTCSDRGVDLSAGDCEGREVVIRVENDDGATSTQG